MANRIAITFLVIVVLVASILPTCGAVGCCANDAATAMHREMPCCAEPTLVARDTAQVLPSVPVTIATVELIEIIADEPPHHPTSFAPISSAHQQPSPPLFLLNEQFLI